MSNLAFAYKRKDNYRWRNAYPMLTYQLITLLASHRHRTQLKNQEIVMIIGCGRSGTSALKEVLAGHSQMMPLPFEANQLWHPKLYPWRAKGENTPPIWRDPIRFTKDSLELATEEDCNYLHNVIAGFANLHGSKTILLKSAMVAFMIPQIVELFPSIKFIHLYRDGRAVALSLAKKQFKEAKENEELYRQRGHWMEYDELLLRMSQLWVEHMEEIERQDRLMKLTETGKMVSIGYEAFCNDPRRESNKMAATLGWNNDGFEESRFAEVSRSESRPESQIAESDLSRMMEVLGPSLLKLNYEL